MNKFTAGSPQAPDSSSILRATWATIHPAHAVQKAAAIISFDEAITSFTVKKIVDAVRDEARAAGLVKETPINSVVFQVLPGSNPHTSSNDQVGTAFQDVRGDVVVSVLNVTNEAIRFETSSYSRWVAFREVLGSLIAKCVPIFAQTTTVKQIAVEYIDFFFARSPGAPDAGLVLDRKSGSISSRAFNKREPFHSHSGWFESLNDTAKRLVNVDVTVNDANGPDGLRRTITVRTYEGEVLDATSPRVVELMDPGNILAGLDVLHLALKSKLADVLTRDARALISLGS